MIGEQIAELEGKVVSQRVLNVEGPTIETNVSAMGRCVVCTLF
jgi:cytoskeletal protein CcmA (bactofilin family)